MTSLTIKSVTAICVMNVAIDIYKITEIYRIIVSSTIEKNNDLALIGLTLSN